MILIFSGCSGADARLIHAGSAESVNIATREPTARYVTVTEGDTVTRTGCLCWGLFGGCGERGCDISGGWAPSHFPTLLLIPLLYFLPMLVLHSQQLSYAPLPISQ